MGRLRTLNWKCTGETKVMKPAHDANGYLRTMIKRGGKYATIKMHRLVAQSWIPNPDDLPEVNHLNNKRDDNRIENLEWVTREQNKVHMMRQGRQTMNKGSKNGMSKRTGLTEEKVAQIRREYNPHIMKRNEWAAYFGIGIAAFADIVYGRSWKHVSSESEK